MNRGQKEVRKGAMSNGRRFRRKLSSRRMEIVGR